METESVNFFFLIKQSQKANSLKKAYSMSKDRRNATKSRIKSPLFFF